MQGTQTTIRQKWHWTLILKVSTRGTHLSSRFLHEGHTSPQGSYTEDTLVLSVPTWRTHLSSSSYSSCYSPLSPYLSIRPLYCIYRLLVSAVKCGRVF